jgi:hypothetical protein
MVIGAKNRPFLSASELQITCRIIAGLLAWKRISANELHLN